MKNILKQLPLASAIAAAALLSSCSNDDNQTEVPDNGVRITIPASYCFNAAAQVTEAAQADKWSTFAGSNIIVSLNYTTYTCDLLAEGIRYSAGSDVLQLSLTPIPFTSDSKGFENRINAPGPFQVVSMGRQHSISNLEMLLIIDPDRKFENQQKTHFYLSFVLDDQWQIKINPYYNYYYGVTSTTGGPYPSYSTSETTYCVSVAPQTRDKATVTLYKPRFAAEMPQFKSMEFRELPVSYTSEGIKIDVPSFVPYVYQGDAMLPADRFTITDFSALLAWPALSNEGSAPGLTPGGGNSSIAGGNDMVMHFTVGNLGEVEAKCSYNK